MTLNEWLEENAEYQSMNDVMSNEGMDYDDIYSTFKYMAEHHYIPWETYTGWDVSQWLKERCFRLYRSKEAFAVEKLVEMSERIPAGIVVDWDATADYFLTDQPHYELENGSVAVWNDN